MKDEEISRLTFSQIIALINRLLEELETREDARLMERMSYIRSRFPTMLFPVMKSSQKHQCASCVRCFSETESSPQW